MAYDIRRDDIIMFRGGHYSVRKHYGGTRRVTLVPVHSTESGRVFVVDGKPRVFKEVTIEREAELYQHFVLQSLND